MKKFAVGSFPVGGAIIKENKFSLIIAPNIEPGVYRFVYSVSEGEKYLDIIINGIEKEIEFSLKANDEQAIPFFKISDENQKWYGYIAATGIQLMRIDLLNQFINTYPNSKSNVIKASIKEWELEKELYWQNLNTFKNEMQGTWAFEMVGNRPYYFTDPFELPRIQDYYKRENFWNGFNATNPKLINTPLYTDHIINYLRYWMNPNMNFSAEEKINGFKRSVDVIIRQFSGNEKTQAFAYKYLTLGFKELGEEAVLQYLDEKYKDLANQCFDAFEKSEFDKRMEGYAAMKVGNAGPNFELNLSERKNLSKNLYDIKTEKTLIVFWSSSCQHCIEEMPKVNEWAIKQKEVVVLAISLDTDSIQYNETIKQFPNLLHTCDFEGWETEAASDYFIVATPTFILLDKEKKIKGKYSSLEQFN